MCAACLPSRRWKHCSSRPRATGWIPGTLRTLTARPTARGFPASAKGLSGFGEAALKAVLFQDSAFASVCAGTPAESLPYSVLRAGARDLEALGELTGIEPAAFLTLAAHGCVDQLGL